MTESELKEYKKAFLVENADPEVRKLEDEQKWCNVPDSSNRHAWRGVAWIDYWRAFTGTYENGMTCSCCGKAIFADTNAVDAHFARDVDQDVFSETEDVQACGGHVYISADGDDEYSGGTYITPLCKKCNNCTVGALVLKEESLLVAEIGETVDGE